MRTIPCAAVYQEREKRTPKLGRSKSKQTPTRQAPSPKRAEIAEDNVPWYKRAYINITGFPFPLGPLFSRRTIRYEVRAFVLTAATMAKLVSTEGRCLSLPGLQMISWPFELMEAGPGVQQQQAAAHCNPLMARAALTVSVKYLHKVNGSSRALWAI